MPKSRAPCLSSQRYVMYGSRSTASAISYWSHRLRNTPRAGFDKLRPMRPNHIAIPECAALGCALLRVKIDVHHAPALAVPGRPLEIVQQRPCMIAPQVDPSLDRPMRGRDMGMEELYPLAIVNRVAVEDVVRGNAVLGDRERQIAIVLLDPHQEIIEPIRINHLPPRQ